MGCCGHDQPETIDPSWLRKMALNFEKRISKNAELRAKFEDEPQKYVADCVASGCPSILI